MEESGLIEEYAQRIAAELDFDRGLARCVRQEVEDHLWEAAEPDRAGGGCDAARRAVANFGDPRAIAAQFAVVSLTTQARRVGGAAVVAIAAAFVAMKARIASYALMQSPGVDGMEALRAIVGSIDRGAFWLAVVLGLSAWLYIDSRGTPATFTRRYRAQLRRFFFLSAAATAALIVSVACDGVLTSFRLSGTRGSAEFMLPVFSMTVEIVCAGLLVACMRGMARRAAFVERLPV